MFFTVFNKKNRIQHYYRAMKMIDKILTWMSKDVERVVSLKLLLRSCFTKICQFYITFKLGKKKDVIRDCQHKHLIVALKPYPYIILYYVTNKHFRYIVRKET